MKKYLAFYIPYLLFVLIFTVLVLFNTKAYLHLLLTSYNTPFLDMFFHYYTFLGDWFPYLAAALLLFYRYRIGLFVFASQAASGLVSVGIKQTWNEPRPLLYFKEHFPIVQLHQVAGEHLHTIRSFPSGHTVTAFAFFLALAFFVRKPSIHFLCFIMAFLVGFSRIYLSQHFAGDVLVGSLIGVLVTTLCKLIFDLYPLKWADGSLRDVFSTKRA